MKFRTLNSLDLAGRRVLIRVDVNAPVQNGRVTDDTRLRAIAPTIGHVLGHGGKPILLSHFGRPKGKPLPELSLSTIRPALELALGVPVDFCGSTVGPEAAKAVADLGEGRVLLLENTRFHIRESANDAGFAAEMAASTRCTARMLASPQGPRYAARRSPDGRRPPRVARPRPRPPPPR